MPATRWSRSRGTQNALGTSSLGVDVHPGDIRDPDSLHGPMAGVDGVFHIAGWYKIGSKDSADGERINVARQAKSVDPSTGTWHPKGGCTSRLAALSSRRGAGGVQT